MGKVHIDVPEGFHELLRSLREQVSAKVDETLLAAAMGARLASLASVTTNVVSSPPPSADEILDSIRAAAAAMPPPRFYDIVERSGFGIEPQPLAASKWLLRYPLYVASPSAFARISLDPGTAADEYPTLRAELILPDTPELRRAWRLYNSSPKDPRRLKRCVRLFRRLTAQASSE